jgi:hypothetical protein
MCQVAIGHMITLSIDITMEYLMEYQITHLHLRQQLQEL